ncbi:MAG TPA: alanine racemase [bacterium]|nr:alanine racemase [bacterium]
MIAGQPYKTWVEVSSTALSSNIENLRSVLAPGVEFCAVIKANAYGHGTKEVARAALKAGVTTFAVDSVDEALLIRAIDPACTVFILGFTLPSRYLEVVLGRFVQTVYDPETIAGLAETARAKGTSALINLKLETGLHRQGMDARELEAAFEAIKKAGERITVFAVGSHFASSEDIDRPEPTFAQMQKFETLAATLADHDIAPKYAHMACSAAALTKVDTHYNMVRIGLSLYGLWPSASVRRAVTLGRQRVDLVPALSWKTTIAQVKSVVPGAQIGYGGHFVVNRPMRIAVLPVGYYDGYDRKLSRCGEVIVRGTRCPVLGNICMNMFMIDVSTVPAAKAGDTVTLLGRDGMNAITADDMADKVGTINYEIVTRINPLLPRIVV